MADVVVEWQGLTIGGDGSPYYVQTVTGWDDLPEVTAYDEPRTRGHGDHVGDQFARARIVTVEGTIADPSARNELARALAAVSTVRSDVSDLTVTTFGDTLTAGARLLRRSLSVQVGYGAGLIPFALQWRCPDPLRYGPAVTTSTGLPSTGGGIVYPLTYGLSYGTPGSPGNLTVSNPGSAPTSVLLTVTGPLNLGFEIAAGEDRLTYPVEVPAGQPVVIDTGAGTVLVEGTADRRANLTNADWIQVQPGESLTVSFSSLGGFDAAALLTATARPAYW